MHDHNLDDLIIDNIEPKNSKVKSFLTIIALLIVVLIVAIVLTRILLKTPDNNDLVFEQETAELIAPELKLQETPKPAETKQKPKLSSIVESKPKPTVVEEKKPEIVKEPAVVDKKEEPKPIVKAPVEPKVVETKKAPVLSNIVEQEVKAPVVETKKPVEVDEAAIAMEKAQDAADTAYWEAEQKRRKAEQTEKAAKEAREKAQREAKEGKEKAEQKAREEAEKKAKEAREKAQREAQEALQATKPVTPKQEPKSTSGKKYYVQVGSFKNQPSSRFISVIKNNGFTYRILRSPSDGAKKLLIGPYENRASVNRALAQVRDRINKRAFVVKR